MAEELALADIHQAFLEYRANFKEPIADAWYSGGQGKLVGSLLKALAPWRVGLDNVSWNQTPKNLAEVQLTVGVPAFFVSIQVGIVGVTMTAFDPDWDRAPSLASLFQAASDAVQGSVEQQFVFGVTTLGFHVKPGGKPFREIMSQFVNAKALGSEDASMFGISVYHKDFSFVMDNSASIEGGLFIKLNRGFAPATSFEEMGKTLFSDEVAVLARLGLKVQ